MKTLSYKTLSVNKESSDKRWYLVNAENQTLGRMASRIAFVLRGKHKPNYTPHVDCGDYIVVINSEKIIMTGQKMNNKEMFSHTGYPGGQTRKSPAELMRKDGTSLVKSAVKGMLPKNKLGAAILRNLYVYVGEEHKHSAQKPEELDLNKIK